MASRGFTGSTPARFRLTSLISLAAIVAAAVTAIVAAQQLTEASDRVNESTGPVLVATQDVFASIAEAAVHLLDIPPAEGDGGWPKMAVDADAPTTGADGGEA